jgi:hypothetical protein
MRVSKLTVCAGLIGLFACGGDQRTTSEATTDVDGLNGEASSASGADDASDTPSSRSAQDSPSSSVSDAQGVAPNAMQPRRSSPPVGAAGDNQTPSRSDGSAPSGASGPSASSTLQSTGPLPDLVLDEAYLLDSTRFDTQTIQDPCAVQQGCATGLGDRRVVRFGSRMGNIGEADFLLGPPDEQNALWTPDSCSMRFSLAGFARYELRDAAGQLVLTGTKNEFCMTDAEEWIPESGAQCHKYTCKNQGIVPGCADNYGTDLPCQWLDVTDVPAGDYELSVTVNAAHAIAEQDYANNNVTLGLHIDADGTGTVLR